MGAGRLVALGGATQPGTGVRDAAGAGLEKARVADDEDATLEPDDTALDPDAALLSDEGVAVIVGTDAELSVASVGDGVADGSPKMPPGSVGVANLNCPSVDGPMYVLDDAVSVGSGRKSDAGSPLLKWTSDAEYGARLANCAASSGGGSSGAGVGVADAAAEPDADAEPDALEADAETDQHVVASTIGVNVAGAALDGGALLDAGALLTALPLATGSGAGFDGATGAELDD